jgi:hypothetical protein
MQSYFRQLSTCLLRGKIDIKKYSTYCCLPSEKSYVTFYQVTIYLDLDPRSGPHWFERLNSASGSAYIINTVRFRKCAPLKKKKKNQFFSLDPPVLSKSQSWALPLQVAVIRYSLLSE